MAKNQILEIGSGVALGDVDRDGHTDIYLCSISGANRLYRNLGHWRFQDVTSSNIACEGQFSTGAVMADIDGDGDLDLLVNAVGAGTRMFFNEGGCVFRENMDSGLVRQHGSTSMALADVDGDGFLDLYVANYHSRTIKDAPPGQGFQLRYQNGKLVIDPPGVFLPLMKKDGGVSLFERGESDFFYRNTGRGQFAPISWTNGNFLDGSGQALAEAPKDWGLAAAFRDVNGDRAPDLYVCNDFFNSPDYFWINDGQGNFRAAPPTALRQISMSSMAVDFADIDRDGHEDFVVLDMMSPEHERRHRQRGSLAHRQAQRVLRDPSARPEYPRNTFYWNRGDNTYAEIAQYSGIEASEWTWSAVFLDVDLDGYEDLLVTNGNLRDLNDADTLRASSEPKGKSNRTPSKVKHATLECADMAFRNRGDLTFEERGREWGFDTLGISHGMALADLDNDGDLDVVVNHMRQAAGLYRNNTRAARVAVRAIGKAPNTQGIGAKISLLGGAVPQQSQEVISGGRYLSGDDPIRVFAAGAKKDGMSIKVTWRNGTETVVPNVRADQIYEVFEVAAEERPTTSSNNRSPLHADQKQPFFEDVSTRLAHPHQEDEFVERDRQLLLARELNRLGPGLTWRDLDGNGWDDLILAGGKKHGSVIYLNDGKGQFRTLPRKDPQQPDETTVLVVSTPEGLEVLAGASNYKTGINSGSPVVRYEVQRGTESPVGAPQTWSVGPLALGVIGKQLVLFAGGRVQPGRYPEAVPSQLYLQENGNWRLDRQASAGLGKGMASGAAWADLDGDGALELVVASDWGPIRVYRFKHGSAEEITEKLKLRQYLGWWNGVSAGDFDGDGRLDLLAANWGRNTRYQRHRDRPVRMYFGDWLGMDRVEMLEAYYNPSLGQYVPFLTLDTLREASPALAEKFTTFTAYAAATIPDITGLEEGRANYLEANWFETTLFLNRGDHFEARALPAEAQFSPAFGVAIGDYDGDGHEDAFLAQNLFYDDPEISRSDAGRGLWLRGDGTGNLLPVPGQLSGVKLYGEQRGAALCDFDADGRVDLAVAQNNGPTALFRNTQSKPGLRIRLKGPSWNRESVGAVIRLKFGQEFGAARAVQVGSGYWSQASLVQVMGGSLVPTAVWVRWPGGHVSETPIKQGETELLLSHP